MKLKGSSYFLIFIMVSMLVVIIASLRMEYYESKLLPLLISGVVFILAGMGLRNEIMAKDGQQTKAIEDETGGVVETKGGWRGNLVAGAWLVGFFLAIYLIGFVVAIPLFVLAYMKSHGTRWLVAITSAVLTTAFIYGIFEFALKVDLYRGLLFSYY